MPDLSKRPARYLTALVTAVLAGGYAVTTFGVRIGEDPRLAELGAENAMLRQQAEALGDEPPARSGRTCASFPDREAAQAYWVAHRAEYPDWDGNRNGVVCEQLKSRHPGTVTRAVPGATATRTRTGTGTRTTTRTRVVVRTGTAPTSAEVPARAPAPPRQESPKEPATKPTAPSKARILASTHNFGLYTATGEEFDGIEAMMQRTATIRGYFQGWDSAFRPARVNDAWSRGQLPLLTWESRSFNGGSTDYSLASIVAGAHDGFLRGYARDIRKNGLPLAIRFDHEMNGNWYPWGETTPGAGNQKGQYAAAWRHVHDIFAAEQANDLVIWVWAPNRIDPLSPTRFPPIADYYPGARYVDWVGMSGYYREGTNRPSFSRTFDKTLAELRTVAPGKRIVLAEVGATASTAEPDWKLRWVADFFVGLRRTPDVIGFVWFNYAVTRDGATDDWRVNFDEAIKSAFRKGLADSGYGRPYGTRPSW